MCHGKQKWLQNYIPSKLRVHQTQTQSSVLFYNPLSNVRSYTNLDGVFIWAFMPHKKFIQPFFKIVFF